MQFTILHKFHSIPMISQLSPNHAVGKIYIELQYKERDNMFQILNIKDNLQVSYVLEILYLYLLQSN